MQDLNAIRQSQLGLEKAISMVEEDDYDISCLNRTQDALWDAWDGLGRLLSGETQLVSTKPTQLRPKRRVFVNMPLPDSYLDLAGFPTVEYPGNKIRTSKYTPWTFIPKFLFEQFRRIANSKHPRALYFEESFRFCRHRRRSPLLRPRDTQRHPFITPSLFANLHSLLFTHGNIASFSHLHHHKPSHSILTSLRYLNTHRNQGRIRRLAET